MRFWRTRSNKKQNLRRGISAGGFFESLEERQLMNAVFVAPWGNDSANGSVQAPVQSVQHAIDMAKPGDVITLRGGNYAGGINIDKGGLTIQSAPGERATISAPIDNEGVQNDVHLDLNASNIKLLNLDLSGGYYYAVKAESNWDTGAPSLQAANNILIQGCRIHDSGRDVIKLTPGTNNITIQGSEIFNSGQRDPSNAEGVDGVQTNNFTMRDSYIHNTTTNGIYIKGGSVNTLIERNRISDISQAGILLGQSSDENWFDTKVNPGYYESINGTVRNNIIWNTQGAGMGAWAALNAKFYNNTLLNVAESMQGGFLISSQEHWIPQDVYVPSTNVTMQNNIVQVNSNRPVFDIREGALTGSLVLGHNLYYAPGHGAQFWDERNNAVGNMAQWRAAYGDVGAMEADPKLDGSGHLQAGSPAIDAGAPVGGFGDDIDHQGRGAGRGWDIGADEAPGAAPKPVTQPVSKPVTQPTPKPVAPPVSKPVAQPTPTPKPVAQPPKTNQPTFQGLTATYFNTPYLSGSKVTRVDRTVNFNWRNGIPAPGIGADNFSARWTGKITPRFSDVYTFYTASDDGVRVWVNGKLIINNWTDHAESDNKGYIALQAGKKYDIKMEYYEHLGQAEAKLLWASQHQIKQIVPVGALSPA